MRARVQFYGWYDAMKGLFFLTRYPPDSPIRPSVPLASKAEAIAIADRKRGDIYWWPPLPMGV